MASFGLKHLKRTKFLSLYEKLISGSVLSITEQEALLSIAIILINTDDEHTSELGYRLIVMYSNLFDNFIPLYEIALNKGYIPVLKSIERHPKFASQFNEKFFNLFLSSSAELYKNNEIYLTYQQRGLDNFFAENNAETISVIAPTSYGKSGLITSYCNNNHNENICVLVPTKALLAQTRRRLLGGLSNDPRKIITHPDMFNASDSKFIAVLTQERLLRLITRNINVSFDTVFIDEAHNLLENDQRNVLLAQSITLLENRNNNTCFKFLTPFLVDSKNLETRYTKYKVKEFKITESIKTEKYYCIDFKNGGTLKSYDQYLDKFISLQEENHKTDIGFIMNKKASKNIIYLNSPRKIEQFSRDLLKCMNLIEDKELENACKDLSKYLHSDYMLIDCIRRGFAYHHGSVPDIVRLFIEDLFSKSKQISIIITSSTLLEGVNIPAERLFLLECKKGRRNLSPSQFKNLSGRVCRFREIFDSENGSLSMLEPGIYVIKSEYMNQKANIERFLTHCVKVDSTIKDDSQNILLNGTTINDKNSQEKKRADEYLENIQKGLTSQQSEYAKTTVGKLCYLNNITEIPILKCESQLEKYLSDFKYRKIDNPVDLIGVISDCFLVHINKFHQDYEMLSRLSNEKARRFYGMFLEWRMKNASYSQMIKSFLTYWDDVNKDVLIYVGRWGDTEKGGYRKLWVDISKKSFKERVNLAIVRIKEEQDFVDNNILKYVEIMNELDILDKKMYLRIKYGTDDLRQITLIRCGMSNTLASLLLSKYTHHLQINIEENIVEIGPGIISDMQGNGENSVLVFEVSFYIKNK